jgi:hypothetical protein
MARPYRLSDLLDRWPCTWLTLRGYVYKDGSHPAEVVSEMLVRPDCNPQLLWRVRATAVHFWENGDWRDQPG